MNKVIKNIPLNKINEIENVIDTKTKYGICFIGKDIKKIQRIIDQLVNGHPEDVYDLSYYRDKHYTSFFVESEFRYMRFRSLKKCEYKSKDARNDLQYWTQSIDRGHILFIIIPKEPNEYFEFSEKEMIDFNKKFLEIKMKK